MLFFFRFGVFLLSKLFTVNHESHFFLFRDDDEDDDEDEDSKIEESPVKASSTQGI